MKKVLISGLFILALGLSVQAKSSVKLAADQPAKSNPKTTEVPDCQAGLLSCGWTYMVCGVAGLDPMDVYDALDEFVCGPGGINDIYQSY